MSLCGSSRRDLNCEHLFQICMDMTQAVVNPDSHARNKRLCCYFLRITLGGCRDFKNIWKGCCFQQQSWKREMICERHLRVCRDKTSLRRAPRRTAPGPT